MADGYMDKILSVDLTSKGVKVESTDKEIARNYIGGKGLRNLSSLSVYEEVRRSAGNRPVRPR